MRKLALAALAVSQLACFPMTMFTVTPPSSTGGGAGGGGGGGSNPTDAGLPMMQLPPLGPLPQGAPRIFFTDLTSGPNVGGEGGAGLFVTLYGTGFGTERGTSTVTVGGGEVQSYRAWGERHLWYQKLVVQLGARATSGDLVVRTARGTSNALPFTVRAGAIYFVSPTGDDGANGAFDHPFRTVRQCKRTLAAGDTCYLRDGVAELGEENYDATLSIEAGGTDAAPMAFVAYPGATATIGTNSSVYGARVPLVDVHPGAMVLAGLRFRGHIALDVAEATGWRVVGNDFSCPEATGNIWSACFVAEFSERIAFVGNYTHDSARAVADAPTKGFHEVYFTTDTVHVEAAWNEIKGGNSCRGMQFHSSPAGGNSGQAQYDLSVHDNYVHDTHCDGINFATVDPSRGRVEAYNNLIVRAGTGVLFDDGSNYACIYVAGINDVGPAGSGTIEVFNNTLVDCGSAPEAMDDPSGAVQINSGTALSIRLRNNVIALSAGQAYLVGSDISGERNLFFGAGAAPSLGTSADPMFVDAAQRDFRLRAGSPAIDAAMGATPLYDLLGNSRPAGGAADLGALEAVP